MIPQVVCERPAVAAAGVAREAVGYPSPFALQPQLEPIWFPLGLKSSDSPIAAGTAATA